MSCSDDQIDTNEIVDEQPTGERWDPLGANDLDNEVETITQNFSSQCTVQCLPHERLRMLEEEQEILNASLFQLTTHFAQVQFRLRQVVDAPAGEKEHLLKSLEEFAFRGVADTSTSTPPVVLTQENGDRIQIDRLAQRQKQLELIEQLKNQLTELENFTFQSKDSNQPPEHLLEKQRVLIDELKHKINVSGDENRSDGDGASSVTPLRMKEQLVNQFKMQIADLERFIEFLQEGSASLQHNHHSQCTCSCPIHGTHTKSLNCQYSKYSGNLKNEKDVRSQSIGIMKKAATLLQMFVLMQFGCGSEPFRKNNLKPCFNHWGDLRAKLEIAVGRIEELLKQRAELIAANKSTSSQTIANIDCDDYSSDNDNYIDNVYNNGIIAASNISNCNARITSIVRKQLAPAIRDLMQHGLLESLERTTIVPFIMCFNARYNNSTSGAAATTGNGAQSAKKMHAWELILEYYELKNGQRYNTTPARKLSQSFNLELADTHLSNKQSLLCAIGSIIASHTQYKRSYDAHFKAFICAALNANKLVIWLSIILQCKRIILNHYNTCSYVIKTGFQDTLQSLDRLTTYKFNLPEDLAVRHFQNIKDVFM